MVYLLPISLDHNPIELPWSEIRAMLNKVTRIRVVARRAETSDEIRQP